MDGKWTAYILQNRLFRMVGEDALESIEVRPVKEESVDLLISLSLRQEKMVFFRIASIKRF